MITQQEYLARRKKLANQLPPDSVALVFSAPECLRNGDAHYRFRQESNFYYLTGFREPDAALIILAGQEAQSILFNRQRDPSAEQWSGLRLGQEGALKELHMDIAYPIEQLEQKLPEYLAGKNAVYFIFSPPAELSVMKALRSVKEQNRQGVKAPEVLCDLEPVLAQMRLIKSEAELNLMRQAARLSVEAHSRLMQCCSKMNYEYQLEAEFLHELTRNSCRSTAYDSIIASGERACILHYTENNQPLDSGSLVLIDAGGEYDLYAADISRTFPVNGVFSPDQRSLYELVLKAQKAGIAVIKPGVAWNSIQEVMVRILTAGLCDLGILKGSVEALISSQAYKPFYMHNSGHWLGLDVHDAGSYKIGDAWRLLEPGMVLTVEPGLYIQAGTPGVEKRWWGMGIRIEDDVLVTQSANEVLTAALPVEVDDIEALMRG